MNFFEFMSKFVRNFDSPEKALNAIVDTPVPYKYRRAKKLMIKSLRAYIYASGKDNLTKKTV